MKGYIIFAITVLMASCQPGAEETSANQSVVAAGRTWPNPQAIPVCIVNFDEVDASLLDDVKNHTTKDFSTKVGIHLIGWNACSSSDLNRQMIRVYYERRHNWSGGNTITAGGGLSMVGPTQTSCFDNCYGATMKIYIGSEGRYPNPSSYAYRYAVTHTRATAVHEFGHALGLLHEHERSDAPACGDYETTTLQDMSRGIVYVGAYDPDSIMNYCHNRNLTTLSSGDVAGLQYLYPGASRPATPPANEPGNGGGAGSPNPSPQESTCDSKTTNATAIGRTERTGARAAVSFQNTCSVSLQAFWINGSGESIAYGTIPAGGSLRITTYLEHAWQFRNARTGAIVKEFKIANWMNTVSLP